MKQGSLLTLFFIIFSIPLFSQNFQEILYLETPLPHFSDARSIAIGEQFSPFYNPALLSKEKTSFNHSYRGLGDINDHYDNYIRGFDAIVNSELGFVQVSYKTMEAMIRQPEIYIGGGFYENKSELIGVSFGKTVGIPSHNVSIAIGIDYLTTEYKYIAPLPPSLLSDKPSTDESFFAKIGLLYNRNNLFIDQLGFNDNILVGISFNNLFGVIGFDEASIPVWHHLDDLKLRRDYRLSLQYGVSYSIPGKQLVSVDLMGEYRGTLNSDDVEFSDPDISLGAEANIYEMLTLRLGAVKYGNNSYWLGKEDEFNIRYGVGINVPPGLLNKFIPVTLRIDYAHIPHNTVFFKGSEFSVEESADVFKISVIYTGNFLF